MNLSPLIHLFRFTLAVALCGSSGSLAAQVSPEPAASGAKPAVIRILFASGMLNGKPQLTSALTTAYQQRLLEKEFQADGIPIEWDFYTSKRARFDAYRDGRADFTNMGPVDAVIARAEGWDYKVIMALHRFDAGVSLATRMDSPIRSVTDLRGQRLETYPGTYHLTLCRLLEKHGVARTEVQMVMVEDPGVIRAGYQAGRCRASLAYMDEFSAEERRATRVLFDPGPDSQFGGVGKFCVSGEFERRYPAIVQRVVTALVGAAAWISDEKNRADVLQAWGTSPTHAASLERSFPRGALKDRMSPLMDSFFHAGLQRDSDDVKRFDLIKAGAEVRVEGWVDSKYLNRALSELRLERYWPERDVGGITRTLP